MSTVSLTKRTCESNLGESVHPLYCIGATSANTSADVIIITHGIEKYRLHSLIRKVHLRLSPPPPCAHAEISGIPIMSPHTPSDCSAQCPHPASHCALRLRTQPPDNETTSTLLASMRLPTVCGNWTTRSDPCPVSPNPIAERDMTGALWFSTSTPGLLLFTWGILLNYLFCSVTCKQSGE